MCVTMPTFSGVDILLPHEINLRGCDTLALVVKLLSHRDMVTYHDHCWLSRKQ